MSDRYAMRCGALVAAVVASCVGCSTLDFDLRKKIPWGEGADGRPDPPLKIVAMWTDTVMSRGGSDGATRGFGGRLMFYGDDGTKPIKVSGSLVVYAFDETGRDPENTRPDRKYVFTAEQFASHYSKSALGHSYSVWVPWDAAGGPMREISLLVRFTPDRGPVVVGEASRQVLPGHSTGDPAQYAPPQSAAMPHSSSDAATARYDGAVRPVGYEAPLVSSGAPADDSAGRRMSTTTIALPETTGVRAALRATSPPHGGWNDPQRAVPTPLEAAPFEAAPTAVPGAPTNVVPGFNSGTAAPAAPVGFAAPVGWPGGTTATEFQTPATAQEGASSGRFGPRRHRPLGAPLARLERGHAPSPPSPTAPPSALPSTPGSVPAFQSATISPAAVAGSR